jgi:hypothetical protein
VTDKDESSLESVESFLRESVLQLCCYNKLSRPCCYVHAFPGQVDGTRRSCAIQEDLPYKYW